MLHLIGADKPDRTVARLFGAYDVVVLDVSLRDPKAAGFESPWLRTPVCERVSIERIADITALEPVRLAKRGLDEITPKRPKLLHVVDGLHAFKRKDLAWMEGVTSYFQAVRHHPSNRLLVYVDSLTAGLGAYERWTGSPNVALVQIEGQ